MDLEGGSDPCARSAFTFGIVHACRDATQRITCIAVDPESQRLFLGLASGQVTAHACHATLTVTVSGTL